MPLTDTLPGASHNDCSHMYGGPATITIAYFVLCGIVHKAVRFWRADMLSTGKIEIYTIERFDAASTTCTEIGWYAFSPGDLLRYANEYEPARVDVAAMLAIAGASAGTYTSLHADSAARFAGIELW